MMHPNQADTRHLGFRFVHDRKQEMRNQNLLKPPAPFGYQVHSSFFHSVQRSHCRVCFDNCEEN